MTANHAEVSRGEIVGGHYRLDRILAEGGMGIVWSARDLRLGRAVAVKFLGPAAMSKPIQRERFAREARLASKIRSPHVVQIFGDGVTSGGVPFVVMELLDGESLAAYLAREGRCTLATCGAVMEQVCRALSSAHAQGLVHRDIKPANIFLTPQQGTEPFVRLLDFGIAKELHFGTSGLTQSGELLGTGNYMSPEQFRKPEAVSAATDIWSVGVVLYEMLTGQLPFEEYSFPSLAVRVNEGTYLSPNTLCADLPPELDRVVARALAVHPSQRYSSVEEFGLAFLRVVRTHTSESVIRPDVMRALQSHAAEQPERHTDQATKHTPRWPQIWGALIVLLCGLLLFASWWVLEHEEDIAIQTDTEDQPPTEIAAQPTAAQPSEPEPKPKPKPELAPPAVDTTQTSIQAATSAPEPKPASAPRPRPKVSVPNHHAAPTPTATPTKPSEVPPSAPVRKVEGTKYGF